MPIKSSQKKQKSSTKKSTTKKVQKKTQQANEVSLSKSWKQFQDNWSTCKACELHECRDNIVLAKGKLPCDILFVGEAPGTSENTRGKPFIGPAGRLLEAMIQNSNLYSQQQANLQRELKALFRLAFTNLVCCIPLDENDEKIKEPHKEHIEACKDRLLDFINLASPQRIVAVGQLADKWLEKFGVEISIAIIHPAAILRSSRGQQSLAIQKTQVLLSELADSLISF